MLDGRSWIVLGLAAGCLAASFRLLYLKPTNLSTIRSNVFPYITTAGALILTAIAFARPSFASYLVAGLINITLVLTWLSMAAPLHVN